MKKPCSVSNALHYVWFFGLICSLCAAATLGQDAASASKEQPAAESAAEPATGPAAVVGKISNYVITRKDLEERLLTELHPDEDSYDENAKPADAQSVLMKMLAEKAMIMEARKQDFLQRELVSASIKRYRETRLVNLLAQKYVDQNRSKMTATQDEINAAMQANPKIDQARAKAEVEQQKGNRLLNEYYTQIHTKSGLKKFSQNLPKAIEIYQRLLRAPKEARRVPWIQNTQIKNELTQAEQDTVLAEYAGGKITLKDWLDAYCDIVPPRRPVMDTPPAADEMLERSLQMPLLVWEATSRGLDKDPEFLKQITEYEDRTLLGQATMAKQGEAKEPTSEEITAYFNQNKEAFGTSKQLKIDLIWCDDLATAQKAKADLDGGKDFEAVKEQYSLEKKLQAFYTAPSSEGLFWKDLWAGDPNSIIGPLKGFYARGVKWRIARILEKKPAQVKEYSPDMESQVKGRMMEERRKKLVAQYNDELLKKYPFETYADRIKDIDPLNIP